MNPYSALRHIACAITLALPVVGLAEGQSADVQVRSAPAPDHQEEITLDVGRSAVIRPPWKVTRVWVTDPNVADVEVLTPDKVLVMGRSVGSTDMVLWNNGEEEWRARIYVGIDLTRFTATLSSLFPGTNLVVRQSKEAVIITGKLARAEQADQLRRFLEAQELKYVDMTSVAGVQQVEINVRVAEAGRSAIRALGINALWTGNDFFGAQTIGQSVGGALVPVNIGPPQGALASSSNVPFVFNTAVNVPPLVTLFGGFPGADLQLFLQALAENQYIQILAEPTLVALSGEEASFLAGGEFPIPVVQGGIGQTAASITIEYKEFGIRLLFRPTVLGDNTIRLLVGTEVSELTDMGAVEIQGFRVPALVTRRVETTLELKSGQSFGMAGLMRQTIQGRHSRLPWLGDVPVLGALFRSVKYERNETELIVLVTASLVEPMSVPGSAVPLPTDMHVPPSDWELYAEGRLEGEAPSAISLADSTWLKEQGLDQLRGPGAWASHGNPIAASQATIRPSSTRNPRFDGSNPPRSTAGGNDLAGQEGTP